MILQRCRVKEGRSVNNTSFARFIAITQSLYFFLFIFLTCIFLYFFLDAKIALFIRYSINYQLYKTAEILTYLGDGTIYIAGFSLLFLITRFLLKNYSLSRIFLFMLCSILAPGLVCEILKFTIARTRPILLFEHHIYELTFFKIKATMISFPSGHSMVITAVMLALSFLYSRYWIIFLSIAILISSCRVLVSAHFLSDVIFGMYLSMLIVPKVYQTFNARVPLRASSSFHMSHF